MTSDQDNLKNHASETRDARTDGHSVSAAQGASAPQKPVPQFLTTELVLPKAVREQFEAEQAAARVAQEAQAQQNQVEAEAEEAAKPRHAKQSKAKHAAFEQRSFQGVPTVEELYAAGGTSGKHKAAMPKIPLMADLIGVEEARKRAEAAPAPKPVDRTRAEQPAFESDRGFADEQREANENAAAFAVEDVEAVSAAESETEAVEAFGQEEQAGSAADGVCEDAAVAADSSQDCESDEAAGEEADEGLNELSDAQDEQADSEEGEDGSDAEFEGEELEVLEEDEPARRRSVSMAWRVTGIVLCVVLAVCAVCLGTYGFDRWLHGSDEANFQGTWQIENSDATVTINDKQIIFADDAIYDYKMDSTTKSLSLTLAGLSGEAHYCFSFDKDSLVFADGDPGTALTSAANDFPWWLAQIGEEVLSIDSSKAVPEGAVVLHRSAS